MKISEAIEAARLRAGAWNRERRERAEEKRRERDLAAAQDSHHHSRFWLLNVPALATICAAIVEWYWAVLFCIEATGQLGMDWRTSVGSDTAAEGAWHFLFDIQSVWVLIGLILATMPIVMLSMIWLPVQFAMRGAGRVRRGSLIAVGLLANVLVIVSGTVVMNYNRQDQVREDLVIEQTAMQGRAAIDARLTFEQEQLRLALSNTNPYLNQAANVGAAEWERSYVAQARATNDPRLPMLERALGAARAADQRRANIERLTVERATAAPEAASAAIVNDTVGAELNTFAQHVEVWRPPFVAFICTLIGIFGAWWTLAMLERLNPKDVLRSGWADEAHRIEDQREQEPIAKNPAKMQTVVREENPETGEKRILVTPKPHWRTLKKGQRQQVEVPPEMLPDEDGVFHDGGNRQASVASGDHTEDSERTAHKHDLTGEVAEESAGVVDGVAGRNEAPPEAGDEGNQSNDQTQNDTFDLGDDFASVAEFANDDAPAAEDVAPEQSEPDAALAETVEPAVEVAEIPVEEQAEQAVDHDPPPQPEPTQRDEPETREDRLIANVAAQ